MDKEFDTNYDVKEYAQMDDRRFVLARKEAVFAQSLIIGAILLAYFFAYTLCPKDMSQLTYVFGFPLWFVAASAVFVAAFAVMVVYNLKLSKNIDLSAKSDTVLLKENSDGK